jgi:hypothetical protein
VYDFPLGHVLELELELVLVVLADAGRSMIGLGRSIWTSTGSQAGALAFLGAAFSRSIRQLVIGVQLCAVRSCSGLE